jgi:hypothetical protein
MVLVLPINYKDQKGSNSNKYTMVTMGQHWIKKERRKNQVIWHNPSSSSPLLGFLFLPPSFPPVFGGLARLGC